MQQQNDGSKLVVVLISVSLVFGITGTLLLNHAFGETVSTNQKQSPEQMAKQETQSALKETRKDAQQMAIKTREETALHEKMIMMHRENQLKLQSKTIQQMVSQLDWARAKFEAKQAAMSPDSLKKNELAVDNSRLAAVIKQSKASAIKAEQLKADTQNALKETRKDQQDTAINTRDAIIKHIGFSGTQNKGIQPIVLPLMFQNLVLHDSIHTSLFNINQK